MFSPVLFEKTGAVFQENLPLLLAVSKKKCIFAPEYTKIMGYDIPQPVSQGIDGAQDQENRRIAEIADELRRCCQLYEAELRDGEGHVNNQQIEERVAEQYAKESHLWIPFSDVFELGSPALRDAIDYFIGHLYEIVPVNM